MSTIFCAPIVRLKGPGNIEPGSLAGRPECKEVNSWYRREDFKPTVTICYEFLKRILESLPMNVIATFDILDVPIFGHEEDAADNFAKYIMLQFGEGQAHRLN